MPAAARASRLFPAQWLLPPLLLSAGLNLYWLTSACLPAAPPTTTPAPGVENEEEDDASTWAALVEEVRRARQQRAACRGPQPPALPGPAPGAASSSLQ